MPMNLTLFQLAKAEMFMFVVLITAATRIGKIPKATSSSIAGETNR
jgi:hypothetical protein